MGSTLFRLGDFEFRPDTGELTRADDVTRLRPQAARALAMLVDRPGQLVTRKELTEAIWPAGAAEADLGLNVCIRQIRVALGDDADQPRYVETLRARGYRLVADVDRVSRSAPGAVGRRGRWAIGLAVLFAGSLAVSISSRGAPPERRAVRLVVMPLEDAGPPDSLAYVRQGLTEDVITTLATNDPVEVAVVARTSSFRLANEGLDPLETAAELGADYVLLGTLRETDDGFRVTTRLLDVEATAYAWSEQFDIGAGDLLHIDKAIADGVLGALAREGGTAMRSPDSPTASAGVDPLAHDRVLRARFLLAQFTTDAAARAVELLDQALETDPDYGDAIVELANAHLVLGDIEAAEEAIARARRSAPEASGLDYAAGRIALHGRRDVAGAIDLLGQSIDVEPGVAESRHIYAQALAAAGRVEEAVGHGRVALSLDPVSSAVRGDIGWVFYYAARYEEARAACKSTLELRPESQGPRACVLLAAHFQDDLASEEPIASDIIRGLGGGALDADRIMGEVRTGNSEPMWSWLLAAGIDADALGPVDRARLLALLGRDDEATVVLAAAARAGRGHLWAGVDPVFQRLRDREEFQELLESSNGDTARQ